MYSYILGPLYIGLFAFIEKKLELLLIGIVVNTIIACFGFLVYMPIRTTLQEKSADQTSLLSHETRLNNQGL